MGVLNTKKKPHRTITESWLKAHGFKVDGWGSPYTRLKYNTKNYTYWSPDDCEGIPVDFYFEVIYFPKTFQGVALIHGTPVDVRGKLWIKHRNTEDPKLLDIKTEEGLIQLIRWCQEVVNKDEWCAAEEWFDALECVKPIPLPMEEVNEYKPRKIFTGRFHGNEHLFWEYVNRRRKSGKGLY